MLENRMIMDNYIEEDKNYDEYLEYLAEKDDQNYDDEIWERMNKED